MNIKVADDVSHLLLYLKRNDMVDMSEQMDKESVTARRNKSKKHN